MKAQTYRHVLACVDLRYGSRGLIGAAAEIARKTGARLTLLHLLEYAPAMSDFTPLTPLEERAGLLSAARQRLRIMAAGAGCPQAAIHVIAGRPQRELAEVASALGADLVIVASPRARIGARLRAAIEALARRRRDKLQA